MDNEFDALMESENTENVFEAPKGEETADSEPSLGEVLSGNTGEEGAAEPESPKKEPGYVQKRIEKALTKQREEMNAEFEKKLDAALAPFKEARFSQQADELVASGKIKDRETALEYVKLKGGITEESKTAEPARNEKGQFESPKNEVQKRASELFSEAKTIKKSTGVDVMDYYRNDPEIQENVLSGKWDFSDVYNYVKKTGQTERGKAPTVVRNANGADIGKFNISNASPKEMAKLNEYLEKGGRIDMRR